MRKHVTLLEPNTVVLTGLVEVQQCSDPNVSWGLQYYNRHRLLYQARIIEHLQMVLVLVLE